MADRISQEARSRNMAAIRGKDTKPEMAVRKSLHRKGFRYRLHVKDLPGKPDIVLPKYRTVVFIHGCFWHRHKGCKNAVMPKTNTVFWQKKLNGNVERDQKNQKMLQRMGWRIIVVWECAVKGNNARETELIVDRIVKWLPGNGKRLVISGRNTDIGE